MNILEKCNKKTEAGLYIYVSFTSDPILISQYLTRYLNTRL